MHPSRPASFRPVAALALALALPIVAGAQGWSRTIGGTTWERATEVVTTSDGGYVVAGWSNAHPGAWLLRLDAGGAVTWQQALEPLGNSGDDGLLLRPTPSGGVFVAGSHWEAPGSTGAPGLVELDATGRVVRQRLYDLGATARAQALAVTASGFVLTGSCNGDALRGWLLWLDATGDVVRCQKVQPGTDGFDPTDVVALADGGVVVAGVSRPAFSGFGHVVRLDATGAVVASAALDFRPCSVTSLSIEAIADGRWVVGGTQTCLGEDATSAFVARLDASFTATAVVGISPPPGLEDVTFGDLAFVDTGILVAGDREQDGPAFVARFDAALNVEWIHDFGRPRSGFAGLARTPDGGCVAAGWTRARPDESMDLLALRLDAAGRVGDACGEGSDSALRVTRRFGLTSPLPVTVTDLTATTVSGSTRVVPTDHRVAPTGDDGENDSCAAPVPLLVGAPLARNFCGDPEDWFEILACGGASYAIATSGLGALADTVIDVLSWDCSATLASDDDGGGARASLLDWTCPVDGRYRVRISQRDGTSGSDRGYEVGLAHHGPACATWLRTYDVESGLDPRAAAELEDGSIVVAGRSDAYDYDPVTLRVDDGGEMLGAERLFGAADASARSVAATAGGGYVLAGDVEIADQPVAFLRSVDASGAPRWERQYGRDSERTRLWDVSGLADGGVVAVGSAGGADSTAWILRIDSAGDVAWERELAVAGGDLTAYAVAVLPDGRIVVTSELSDGTVSFITMLDAAGSVLVHRSSDVPRLLHVDAVPDGGLILASVDTILRLSSDGTVRWANRFQRPSAGGISIQSLAATAEGGCIATVYPSGTGPEPPFLIRIDESGVQTGAWRRKDRDSSPGDFRAIARCAGGGFVVAGTGAVTHVLRLDAAGDVRDVCLDDRPLFETTRASVTLADVAPVIVSGTSTVSDVTFAPESVAAIVGASCGGSGMALPDEVSAPGSTSPLVIDGASSLRWEPGWLTGSASFDLYRGMVADLPTGYAFGCLRRGLVSNQWVDSNRPGAGRCFAYLVTGVNGAGEGTMGFDSLGVERRNAVPCP